MMEDSEFYSIENIDNGVSNEDIHTVAVTSSNVFERLKLPRIVAITGMVVLGVGTVSFGVTTFSGSMNSPNIAATSQREEEKEDLAALKSKLSLGTSLQEQEQEIEDALKKEKVTSKPSEKPRAEIEKVQPPQPQSVQPTPVVTTQLPKPVAAQPVKVAEVKPREVEQPAAVISKEPTPAPQPKTQPTPEIEESEDIDPDKEWQQVGQIAGISVSTENETPVEQVSQEPRLEQESKAVLTSYPQTADSEVPIPKPMPREVTFEPTTSQQVESQPQPRRYDIGAGTKSKARLQNPVVLNGRVNQDQRYPIEITEDVKSADDEVLIPKNTTAMAQVVSASTSGNIRMNVESIIVPAGTGVMQQRLPYDFVQVLARSGTPLKAKTRYPRIAIPKETVVANTRTKATTGSKSLKNSNYSPSRQERIIALKRRLGSSRNAARPQLKRYPTLTLKKGTKVQLFVNKSFNL